MAKLPVGFGFPRSYSSLLYTMHITRKDHTPATRGRTIRSSRVRPRADRDIFTTCIPIPPAYHPVYRFRYLMQRIPGVFALATATAFHRMHPANAMTGETPHSRMTNSILDAFNSLAGFSSGGSVARRLYDASRPAYASSRGCDPTFPHPFYRRLKLDARLTGLTSMCSKRARFPP